MTPDRQFDELLASAQAYNPSVDSGRLRAAHAFMLRAHDGQTRRTGEPYAAHPLAVARILCDYRADMDTLIGALLHDTIEDSEDVGYGDIERAFGARVATLVEGVTKVGRIRHRMRGAPPDGDVPPVGGSPRDGKRFELDAETFHKILLALATDLRVLLVKLADRLHNMRTLDGLAPEARKRIARETLAVYAPLAERVGMQEIREEIEDLAFLSLNPRARRAIMRRFVSLRKRSGPSIEQMNEDIRQALLETGMDVEVAHRFKRPYSTWAKLRRKKIRFTRLSDIVAFRIIVEDGEVGCYRALGILHTRWSAVHERFRDYISVPKENGYQSLHTVLHGKGMPLIEVQIRTRDMHHRAEFGIAAHWRYKGNEDLDPTEALRRTRPEEGGPKGKKDPLAGLRNWVEAARRSESPSESVDLGSFRHQSGSIYCFTPEGEVIRLPRDATPVDFAYALHTEIGNRCVGARVDGSAVPLRTRLRSGQEVEVQHSDGAEPDGEWLHDVVTEKARFEVNRWRKARAREESERLGEHVAAQVFGNSGAAVRGAVAKSLGYARPRDFHLALGEERISESAVRKRLRRTLLRQGLADGGADGERADAAPPAIVGINADMPVTLCDNCLPLPKERIVGVRVGGGELVVHRFDCGRLAPIADGAAQDLLWDADGGAGRTPYRARIRTVVANVVLALARICTRIGELGANIENMNMAVRRRDYFEICFDLSVCDLRHLYRILSALGEEKVVHSAERIGASTDSAAELSP